MLKKNIAAALILLLLLSSLVACAPRGTYTSALGDSYRFSGKRYTHTDSVGNQSSGTYEIENNLITLTAEDGTSITLSYQKDGKTILISGIEYAKS